MVSLPRFRVLNKILLEVGGYENVSDILQVIQRVPIIVSSSSEGGLSFAKLGEDVTNTNEPQAGNATALVNYMKATSANQSRIQRRMEELAVNNERQVAALQRQTQRHHEQLVRLLKRTGLLSYTCRSSPNSALEDDAVEETSRRR